MRHTKEGDNSKPSQVILRESRDLFCSSYTFSMTKNAIKASFTLCDKTVSVSKMFNKCFKSIARMIDYC